MKILIIGAQYTGLAAAQYWRTQGHSVTVTTTRDARVTELQAVANHVVVLRGSEADKLRAVLPGHEAVLMSVAGGMVEKDGKVVLDLNAYQDTYLGTAQALASVLADAPSVRHLTFPSSTSAYGDAGGSAVATEDTPPTPKSIFQQVYVDAEKTLLTTTPPHVSVCILRTGNIYGPGRELAAQATAMAGRTVPLDGEAGAMVIHRDDVVRACAFALKHTLSGVYNLVNDVTTSKREFFGVVGTRLTLAPIEWSPFGAGVRQVSNAKIKAAGFQFADPFATQDTQSLLAQYT